MLLQYCQLPHKIPRDTSVDIWNFFTALQIRIYLYNIIIILLLLLLLLYNARCKKTQKSDLLIPQLLAEHQFEHTTLATRFELQPAY